MASWRIEEQARDLASGFSATEVSRLAMLIAVVLWVSLALNLSTPGRIDRAGQLKGADFLQFYVLGHLAADGDHATLFDADAFAAETRRLVPQTVEVFPPVYPPHVSLVFAPFATLPYGWAVVVWSVLSTILYGLACWIVWSQLPALKSYGVALGWLAIGSPAFFNLIAHGQTTSVALALLVGMQLALVRGRPLTAGLALGALAYKPQIAIAAAIAIVVAGEWRVVVGAALSVVLAVLAAWMYYGGAAWVGYLSVLAEPGDLTQIVEQKLHHSHSLRTLWALVLPWRPVALAAYGLSALWVLGRLLRYWRRQPAWPYRFATLLFATVLVSPHLFVYDLVILAPALLIVTDWSLAHDAQRSAPLVRWLVVLSFVAPLVGPVAAFTRIQVSVLLLIGLFAVWTQATASTTPIMREPACQ